MNKIRIHAVARADYLAKYYPDLQTLLKNQVNPDTIPERFYCGGRGVWTFQTVLALKYTYGDAIECSFGPECRSDAINLMHNDDFGSRVKPWKGLTVVARADRPPVLGADYVINQNPQLSSKRNHIFIPHWPQPGLLPRESNDNNVRTVAYFGGKESLPDAYQTASYKQRLKDQGIELRISFNNWTDYRDIDICLSFRQNHDHKLTRKPASKLINSWLGKTVMICDDEPSFHAIRENNLDYLIARDSEETFTAIMALKNSPDLFAQMRKQGEKRVQEYSREAITTHWYRFLEEIWRKGLHHRSSATRALRFAFGKAIRPLSRKF